MKLKTTAERLAAFKTRKPPAPVLPVATQVFTKRLENLAFDLARRKRRANIQPKNALAILPHLPECEDDRLHALLTGNFIFCDIISAIVEKFGPPSRIVCATLSLSLKNVAAIGLMLNANGFPFELLLSEYFSKTNTSIFAAALAVAKRHTQFRVRVARSHCKVTLIDYPTRPLVLEGSSNLRSSDSFEQLSVFSDRGLLDFHAAWIESISELPK